MTALAAFTESCTHNRPEVFVVLGSGMGSLARAVDPIESIAFADIPGLPTSTVAGHAGRLTLGRWDGRVVLLCQGRLHYYEGHPWDVIVKPIQFAGRVGAKAAILTNAAGGIRDDLAPGTLMPIRDHLEWNRPQPWREPARPSPYSRRLLGLIEQGAGTAEPGLYAAVAGPSYETPAEVRALRTQGADAVGMSTTREALAGSEAGMEVAALSLVTNRAAGLSHEPISHEDVIAVGAEAAQRLAGVIGSLLARL